MTALEWTTLRQNKKGGPDGSRPSLSMLRQDQKSKRSDIWIWRGLPMVCVTIPMPPGQL
jgi:hypothetical protein